jgi:Uma2 family endonuclease
MAVIAAARLRSAQGLDDSEERFAPSLRLPPSQAGIPEVWIEDLKNDVLQVHREPAGKTYQAVQMLRSGVVSPLAFPGITIAVDELLSTDYEE